MTPGEVASLQALAQQHGGSLSINPQTGLPEAGFLSALLPMAAGAGLAAMGMPAGYAALSIGAASAATNGGDMKKAILNGFSAYTGAGLADSFMGAGAAMQSGTATSWMGGEAPVTAAAPTIEVAPSAGNLAGASQQEAINQAGMYRGPSYAAEAGNVSLASAAPAEVAQAAAAATPAAQAAQQAASLDTMNMGQRWDALKAGASGTNAMNYIKANPFASLGTATAMLTPDENKTPQKAADTDRGPRAGLSYYPGWSSPLPKPNMQGVEQTYNRPYYAAKGGVTRMATGGITSAPRNQQQLFADYLQRVSSSGVAATPPTNKYDWWKNPNDPAPAAPAPAETAEEYAARMRLNARGGGGGGQMPSAEEREAQLNEVNDYLSTPENPVTMNQYWAMSSDDRKALDAAAAERNPGRAAVLNGVKTLGVPIAYRVFNELKGAFGNFMGPSTNDPKSVGMVFPTEKDRIKAEEAAKYNQSLLGTYSGYTDTGTSGIDRVTAEDAANAAYQRAQAEAENDARIQGDLNPYTSSQFSAAALPSTPYASGRNSNYSPPTTGYTTPEAAPVPSSSLTPSDIGAPSTEPAGGPIGIGYPAYSAVTPAAEGTPYGLNYVGKDPTTGLAIGNPTENRDTFNNVLPTTNQVFGINEGYQQFRTKYTPGIDFTDPNASQLFGIDSSDYEKQVSDLGQYNLGTLAPDALRYSGTGIPNTLKTPDIQNVSEISADPDADKTTESLGIPDAATFAAMLGAPFAQTAALNNGVVSDAGVSGDPALAGYQGGYNPGYATPNMGRASSGVAAGFGGLGSAWRTALGLPVVDGQGNPILTSQGAAQQAYNESPQGVQDANDAETRSLLNRYPSGGRSSDGGDGGDAAGNAAAQTRANDNSATSGGWFGGGGADGGLSTPYGFQHMANGGLSAMANPYDLGSYSDGGRLLKGPGDGVSDSIPATIGKGRPARLADGEFVIPARIVSEIGNGSTDAGARKLYAMMDRIQAGRKKSVGKGKVAVNSRADKYLPA